MAQSELTDILEKYVQKVVPFISPREIILYGSRVRGTAHQDSDIDVAIIVDRFDGSAENFFETWTELFAMCDGIDLRIEPILLEAENDRSGFLAHVRHTGKVLYSRAA
jgi:predicted nucleotidyltransferase